MSRKKSRLPFPIATRVSIDRLPERLSAISVSHPLLLLLLFLLLPVFVTAQEREKLEEKRKQLLREIELTSDLLAETQENRTATLEHFLTLQRHIQKRKQLIETLQTEIELTEQGIRTSMDINEALQADLDRLLEEYGMIARAALRQRVNKAATMFVLSAPTLNEAFRRWQYIRQYDRYRKKQARLIVETRRMLDERLAWLETERATKSGLLDSEQNQAALLADELRSYDRLLAELQQDEKRLSGELREKQAAHQKLNAAIERIIREEMARRRRDSRSPEALEGGDAETGTEVLAGVFEQNRGRLPWPVVDGVVTGYYGRQPHPTLENVIVENNGIDIRTDINADVRSVFRGEVVGTQFIPGYNYMVIVRHGNFYSVYSNLEEVFVKRGEQVTGKQVIGRVSRNVQTNTSSLHFEVWQDKTRMNPLHWLSG